MLRAMLQAGSMLAGSVKCCWLNAQTWIPVPVEGAAAEGDLPHYQSTCQAALMTSPFHSHLDA